MKRYLFDGIALQNRKGTSFHGGGEYAKYILKLLIFNDIKFDIVIDNTLELDEKISNLIQEKELNVLRINSKFKLYELIDKENYDIFYSALPYNYYDYSCKAKLIGVIHGLRQIEIVWDNYKHKFYKSKIKQMIGWSISKSNYIKKYIFNKRKRNLERLLKIPNAEFIVVSNHTKYSLLTYFPFLNERNITVVYSPFEVITSVSNETSDQKNSPYFFMVSGNRFEKNTYRAIKAFDNLFSNGQISNFRVKITGASELPFISEIKNIEKFDLLPYVNPAELDKLYTNAYCFIYPSLNEGFGYPPVIAMSKNIPVIAAASTSIPEVCDNAAIYFAPESVEELKTRILQIVHDNETYCKIIQRGKYRVDELVRLQKIKFEEYINNVFKKR